MRQFDSAALMSYESGLLRVPSGALSFAIQAFWFFEIIILESDFATCDVSTSGVGEYV